MLRHLLAGALSVAMTAAAAAAPDSPPISGDVPEATGWRAETVAGGLSHPWAIAWLPDGSALITERAGRLRVLRDGRLDPKPVPGLPAVFAAGQGGLLDVALHPDFTENRLVYFTLASGNRDANRTALARARFDGQALRDATVIFENADTKSGTQHFGSRIVWLPDRSLLMSIGDGGNPPVRFAGENIRNQAQNPGTHFGKIVRLRDDGTPHPDNPFAGQPGARPEVWTLGHRNIQGMTRDPASRRVWANEHGSRGGDELNVIEGGGNYGWPVVTYSYEYWGPRISDESSRPGIVEPKLVWTPSKAPSGLALYTGQDFPQWRGDLFSGALKAQQIRRIRLEGTRVVGEEKLTIGRRVRDVRQGPDGHLYLLTDEDEGALLRIVPAGQ